MMRWSLHKAANKQQVASEGLMGHAQQRSHRVHHTPCSRPLDHGYAYVEQQSLRNARKERRVLLGSADILSRSSLLVAMPKLQDPSIPWPPRQGTLRIDYNDLCRELFVLERHGIGEVYHSCLSTPSLLCRAFLLTTSFLYSSLHSLQPNWQSFDRITNHTPSRIFSTQLLLKGINLSRRHKRISV